MMDNNQAVKRALDEDVEVNVKRLKTDDLPTLPPIEKIQIVRDPNKWSQLPSVVYELLTLLKKFEKCNDEKDCSDEKLENISDIKKKDLLVLPNENNECVQNSDEKHNTEFLCSVESNKLSTFKSTVEDSILSIKFDFFKNEAKNVEVQNNISLNTKITSVQNIEHNCLQKVEQKEDEAHEETSDFKKFTTTKSVSLTETCMTSLSESIHSTSINTVSAQSTPTSISVSCTSLTTNNNSTIISIPESISAQTPLMCASTKNISSIVVSTSSEIIASMAINNSITTTSNTKSVSSIPITTIVCDMPISTPLESEQKDMLETSRREQILNLLQIHCLNGISVVPTTKPPPCICQYCKHVDNLPVGKSALNNKCTQFINNKNLNTDMYSSDVAAFDCSEPSKDIWVNELCSLIRKNDELHKVPVSNTSTSNTMTSIKNVIKKVTQKIKPLLPFCNKCKKPKHSNSSVCYNCNPPFKNIYQYYDPRSGNKSYFTKHGNRRYRYY